MVWDHGVHLRQSDCLDADSFDDLLVGEGVEQFTRDDLGCDRCTCSKLAEEDVAGEKKGYAGGDDEGEEDLEVMVSCSVSQ